MKRVHVWIQGHVQGVFFRATTRDQARERGVFGWVKNLADGRVEAVFEGADEDVDAMVQWCSQGSPRARVDHVEARDEEPSGAPDPFEIRR